MSGLLLVSAGLTILVVGAHSYLGERYILVRLFRRNDLPKLFGGTEFTKQTLRLVWHVTSVAFLGFASLLASLAMSEGASPAMQAQIISATFAVSGVVAGSRGRHLSWIVFFALAVLTWLAYP